MSTPRYADFDWLMAKRVKGNVLNGTTRPSKDWPFIIGLAAYNNGVGVKRAIDRGGGDRRACATSFLRMLKELGLFSRRASPLHAKGVKHGHKHGYFETGSRYDLVAMRKQERDYDTMYRRYYGDRTPAGHCRKAGPPSSGCCAWGAGVRNLVKAGALIAAEIDRLQRLATPPTP